MKQPVKRRKILVVLLPVLALAFIAGVPVDENKTVLEHLIAAFPSGEADEAQQERSQQSLDDAWEEIQKISANNSEDSVMITGEISLFDNLDDQGIKEQQHFIVKQAGDDQWFHLDSFDRIQYDQTLFLIDHMEKEIVVQPTGAADSLMAAFKMMDPKKLKKMLVKDGATAEINREGGEKILTIIPGLMDAVNRYDIVYDTATYAIVKFRIYYTSIPYQDYLENDMNAGKEHKPGDGGSRRDDAGSDGNEESDADEIDANITEYVVEFEISRKEKGCDMNFQDNVFYIINKTGEVSFNGKLGQYKKSKVSM